ncbi:MAG: hypothetical protein R3F34_09930 [Planctomycetota bacterium]
MDVPELLVRALDGAAGAARFALSELAGVLGPDRAREGVDRLARDADLDESRFRRAARVGALAWAARRHDLDLRLPFVDAVFLRRVAPLLALRGASPSRADERAVAHDALALRDVRRVLLATLAKEAA